MTEIKQKAKFLGKKGQIFNIGAKSFASGVWQTITPDEITAIKEGRMIEQFEFSPLIEVHIATPGVVQFEDVDKKPRKKRKSKKKEGNK